MLLLSDEVSCFFSRQIAIAMKVLFSDVVLLRCSNICIRWSSVHCSLSGVSKHSKICYTHNLTWQRSYPKCFPTKEKIIKSTSFKLSKGKKTWFDGQKQTQLISILFDQICRGKGSYDGQLSCWFFSIQAKATSWICQKQDKLMYDQVRLSMWHQNDLENQ